MEASCDDQPSRPESLAVASRRARYSLGHPLVDSYLEFVAGRSRPNTLRAVAHDLKTFFTVVDKEPDAAGFGGLVNYIKDLHTSIRDQFGQSGHSVLD
jgi:hypothetical protein